MANRIRGTVVIIDATGNLNFPGAGTQARVSEIAFWASDSTGKLQMSFQANTADLIVNMASPVNQPNTTTLRFSNNTYLQSIYVNTVSTGTGYLYLS